MSRLKAIVKSAPGTLSGMNVLGETFERDRNEESGEKHIQQIIEADLLPGNQNSQCFGSIIGKTKGVI